MKCKKSQEALFVTRSSSSKFFATRFLLTKRPVDAFLGKANKLRQKFLVTMDLTPVMEGVSALITTCGLRNSLENL